MTTRQPPGVPVWATQTHTDAGLVAHSTGFGSVPMASPHGELADIALVRFDRLDEGTGEVLVGRVRVTLADYVFDPSEVRRLAALLVQAVDLLDAARAVEGE